jgi:hypothetical protein
MPKRNRTKHRITSFFNHDKFYVERKQTHAPLVHPWCIDCPHPLDRHGLILKVLESVISHLVPLIKSQV